MWFHSRGLVHEEIKHGSAFAKTSDTKATFNLDDLKLENIQNNVTFSENQIFLLICKLIQVVIFFGTAS